MAEISVIVPVYKVEPYLHRCINSILGQSYENFELILVDDGSPDSCGAICDEYAAKDSRIYVIHQKNGGLSAARNAGIDWVFANSDSQWLAFIDSDDWIHRKYLQILAEAADHGSADIAICGLITVNGKIGDRECSCTPEYMLPEQAYERYYGMCITACCKLYRKELFANLRFPEGKLHEDCYTTHIPLFASGTVAVCDVPLYYYYTNPGSITRGRWNPKRLEEIDAHEQRLRYLQDHGYFAAYKRELEVYGDTLLEQAMLLTDLKKQDKNCKPYLGQLRRKLRWVLKQEKSRGSLSFDQGRLWLHLMVWPVEPLYRAMRALQGFMHAFRT